MAVQEPNFENFSPPDSRGVINVNNNNSHVVIDIAEFKARRDGKLDFVARLDLIERAQQGDQQALETVWTSTQHFVERVAAKVFCGLPYEDRVQVGLLAAYGVIFRYKAEKGVLETLLAARVKGAILDEVIAHSKGSGVSRDDRRKLLEAIHGEDDEKHLTEKEKKHNIDIRLHNLVKRGFTLAPNLVTEDREIISQAASLEFSVEMGHTARADTDIEAEVISGIKAEELQALIKKLPPREQFVITRFYGTSGSEPETQEALASQLGVTPSRISQIHHKGLERLRDIMGVDVTKRNSGPSKLNTGLEPYATSTTYDLTETGEAFKEKLSDMEWKILLELFDPYTSIGNKLGIDPSTVRTHVAGIVKKFEVNDVYEVVVWAEKHGIKLTSQVDATGIAHLSGQETIVATKFYNITYSEAAKRLGLRVPTIRSHWHNIYKKTGAFDRVQVLLMGVKAGLIRIDE
jgi:RNA polymerase sigma factor (sigma-70 family)